MRLRPEADGGAGIAFGTGAGLGQFANLLATREPDVPGLAITTHFHIQSVGKGIDHGDAHAMKTTRKAVTLVREFAAGMQLGQDHLDAGDPLLGMDIHRHAAAVIANLHSAIGHQPHVDGPGKTRQGLVHAVIDDLLCQVIGPAGVGVHARAFSYRVEAGQDFNGGGVVSLIHGHG